VLRGAVQALFEKREMIWHQYGRGNASFLVNATSGIVLYEPEQPRDSKVIVSPMCDDLSSKRFSDIITGRGGLAQSTTISSQDLNNKALKKAFDSRRNETRAIERAIAKSSHEAIKEKEEEERRFKKAVSLSILDSTVEMHEDETLQEAMTLSRHEFEKEKDAESAFLEAIELSRKECQEYKQKEEDDLLRALEQSVLDF
jgi:hypothetical protein